MAVTKTTYTATATWTASGLANLFRDAFIDAGLMVDWYDSFLNTVENRVLQVVYDNSKTYGTVYYWFMFTTGGFFVHTALGWNATTHVPTGSQYLDFYSTTTNVTTSHLTLAGLISTTSVTLTRYTSAVNTGCTWFVLRNGTGNRTFMIPSPTLGPSSIVDLDKVAFNNLVFTGTATNNNIAYLNFLHGGCHLRRTFLGSQYLRGDTTAANYRITPFLNRYGAIGNANNTTANYVGMNTFAAIYLPTASVNTNSALSAEHTPVFTEPTASPYMIALPSDFAVASYYASNAMAIQDTLVVSAGTEEWEMLAVANNGNTGAGRVLFLARTI
jgi:hypothetical protein